MVPGYEHRQTLRVETVVTPERIDRGSAPHNVKKLGSLPDFSSHRPAWASA
jgi:hypothetical protein